LLNLREGTKCLLDIELYFIFWVDHNK
jgi:hypothetical protein